MADLSTRRQIGAISRETMEERVYLALRREILQGHLPEGQRLVQDDLANQLGTSRIPVRAALQRLESTGLVTVHPKGYYSVASFTAADIDEIYGLRMLLEPYAAGLSVPNMSDDRIAQLKGLCAAMNDAAQSGDADRWSELNRQFHMSIYEDCDRPRVMRIITDITTGRPSFSPIKTPEALAKSGREHLAMIAAAENRDAALMTDLVRRHISSAGETWQSMLALRQLNNVAAPDRKAS